VWAIWSSGCGAVLIVDPARPITHQVTVQIIETALSNGTSPATVFGDAAQRAGIEAAIDSIWAQAGIDIAFSPPTLRYNNTFAYQGNGGERPTDDLEDIIANATGAGALNSNPAVINMFFVNVVPGFSFTSENTTNGLANIGSDGIAQFVGDNLLSSASGRDLIASVVSHEIGHNLGLRHLSSGQPNLMSPNGSSEQLSTAQIEAIFQTAARSDSIAIIPSGGTGFPQPVTMPPMLGDFNGDGIVNAVDIDRLAEAAHDDPDNLLYDLNDDGTVTFAVGPRGSLTPSDSDILIRDILDTEYGDLDLDRQVYLTDLNRFATTYRQPGQFGWADGNVNGSQDAGTAANPRVFLGDLNVLATHWRFGVGGNGASVAGAVPEPSGWLLAVCGVLAALGRSPKSGKEVCIGYW
jgi:hypothetical protein